ncbi:uncharacterized protein LOC120842507 [Ixodes scapularis]|uniref:uncharacterized protein LOC120842507 n=1 Tax=Ixodes scapularis TaxID=6945 RepID=UPI001A9EDF98|nr:uncharacterized protein LOC120842507 [Ixodes scapularis]
MARLACVFLVFVLAYQCADVVNGAVKAKDLPDYVGNKVSFFEKLKKICKKDYNTQVIAEVQLPQCRVTCANGAFWGIFGGPSTVKLAGREPCNGSGGRCYDGVCAHEL